MKKLRYYGGSFTNSHRGCASCGHKATTSKSRVMSESIQFPSDVTPTGLKTIVFSVGRDYLVTDYEAQELLKMSFMDLNNVSQPKFRVIPDGK